MIYITNRIKNALNLKNERNAKSIEAGDCVAVENER